MKRSFVYFLIYLSIFSPLTGMALHLKKCESTALVPCGQIDKIDYIYLINLDKRTDRLDAALKALNTYGILPYRFSAIYGQDLSAETLKAIALRYSQSMTQNHWATVITEQGTLEYEFLRPSTIYKPIFSEWMNLGAIGCALSHLSVLQDAYDASYETIWVLEDDIEIKKDPHEITDLIEKLDSLTNGLWDILYTDCDQYQEGSLLKEKLWWMWRPDLDSFNQRNFIHQNKISPDFIKIGSRSRTHSMVIRRSGIKKILEHFKNHHFFLPIDHEIAFAENIQLYMPLYPVVTYNKENPSDIQETSTHLLTFGSSTWEKHKSKCLTKLPAFTGWCVIEKANHLMDFIYDYKPNICVEIGTFGGASTLPIASALKYLKQGQVFCIDAWDNHEAVKGLPLDDPNYNWWKEINFAVIRQAFLYQTIKGQIQKWCTVLDMNSLQASYTFADESIDLLYIDGNFSKDGSLQDVTLYLPKVKKGGTIWLNDAHTEAKLPSVEFLMEHTTWLKKESLKNHCIVFQK